MRLARKVAGTGRSRSTLALSAAQQKSSDGLSRKEGVSFGNLESKNKLQSETV